MFMFTRLPVEIYALIASELNLRDFVAFIGSHQKAAKVRHDPRVIARVFVSTYNDEALEMAVVCDLSSRIVFRMLLEISSPGRCSLGRAMGLMRQRGDGSLLRLVCARFESF
jgi:hypothetical protein